MRSLVSQRPSIESAAHHHPLPSCGCQALEGNMSQKKLLEQSLSAKETMPFWVTSQVPQPAGPCNAETSYICMQMDVEPQEYLPETCPAVTTGASTSAGDSDHLT